MNNTVDQTGSKMLATGAAHRCKVIAAGWARSGVAFLLSDTAITGHSIA